MYNKERVVDYIFMQQSKTKAGAKSGALKFDKIDVEFTYLDIIF